MKMIQVNFLYEKLLVIDEQSFAKKNINSMFNVFYLYLFTKFPAHSFNGYKACWLVT